MSRPILSEINLYNRRTQALETEKVPARRLLSFCYASSPGRSLCRWAVSHPLFSRIYGLPFHHPWSRRLIGGFIRENRIDMSEVMIPAQGFSTFNDFFIRRLSPGARPVDQGDTHLIAPADSRLKVFEIRSNTILKIKGHALTLGQLLATESVSEAYNGGLCLQFRLAPCDYHRFAFIAHGVQGPIHSVGGRLYSVNPVALTQIPDIWGKNYRHWCFIETQSLGTIIQIEVGATVVGSIVQHQPSGGPCKKGQEKGYFQMGGSTVLVIVPPDRIKTDTDIEQYSRQGIETLVQYGEKIGEIKGVENRVNRPQ